MNTAKQMGSTNCGLYEIATLTCLALKTDPVTVVFDPEQLRTHMTMCMEKGEVSTFVITKQRRPASRVTKIEVCQVYCYCSLPDDGEKMVCCEKCEDWFHLSCLIISIPRNFLFHDTAPIANHFNNFCCVL